MARKFVFDRKLMLVMVGVLLVLAGLSVALNDSNKLPGKLIVLILIYVAFLAFDAATRMSHAWRVISATFIWVMIELVCRYFVTRGDFDLAKQIAFASMPVVVCWAAEPRFRGIKK